MAVISTDDPVLPALLTIRAVNGECIEDDLTPYAQKRTPALTLEEAIRMDIVALGAWLVQHQRANGDDPVCPLCAVGLDKLCRGFV